MQTFGEVDRELPNHLWFQGLRLAEHLPELFAVRTGGTRREIQNPKLATGMLAPRSQHSLHSSLNRNCSREPHRPPRNVLTLHEAERIIDSIDTTVLGYNHRSRCPSVELLPINVLTMADGDDQHEQRLVLQLTKNPIIADAIPPYASQVRVEHLAKAARVG